MKVVVLGGAGDVGSRAVEALCAMEEVSRLTIADRDAAAAEAVASRVRGGQTEVIVAPVDATDHAALVRTFAGHDVVASALGPFHRFELPAVRAALEAGLDYASVCDESDAAEAVFAELDAPARAAGRTVITGLGASPGLSNLAVRLIEKRLDGLRKVRIAVYQPLDAGGGEAVLRHMMFVMTGQVVSWRDGRTTKSRACSEREVIAFPQYGEIKCWNMGHSEPYTLPRFLPELEEVRFVMGFGPGSSALVAAARAGAFSGRRRRNLVVKGATLAERFLRRGREPSWGALRVDGWDAKGGHALLCGIGQMRETTGLSLAIGTQMLGNGTLTAKGGVFAPEGCLDAEACVGRLAEAGIDAYYDLEMTESLV